MLRHILLLLLLALPLAGTVDAGTGNAPLPCAPEHHALHNADAMGGTMSDTMSDTIAGTMMGSTMGGTTQGNCACAECACPDGCAGCAATSSHGFVALPGALPLPVPAPHATPPAHGDVPPSTGVSTPHDRPPRLFAA